MRSDVSLGDLVRAVRTLGADDQTSADIARLLGLSLPATTTVRQVGVAPAVPAVAIQAPTRPPDRPLREPSAPQRAHQQVADSLPTRTTEVAPLAPESSLRRPPRDIPPLDTLLPAPVAPPNDGESALFVRRWQRGVATGLAGVLAPTGALDIVRIVELVARRSAVPHLPRRSAYTTRMGLQLLVDVGPGMWPFSADVAELETLLRLTISRETVSMLRFDQSPRAGIGSGSLATWTAYVPPLPGTPILAVSDFGLAGPAGDLPSARAEWEGVAEAALVARCPLLALTPFPASRWPSWLTTMFAVVQWDRATTAAMARRSAERASRKCR
jgi:hypothetical protein